MCWHCPVEAKQRKMDTGNARVVQSCSYKKPDFFQSFASVAPCVSLGGFISIQSRHAGSLADLS